MTIIQNVSEVFSLETFLNVRNLTMKMTREIASQVFVGMTEEQGHELIEKTFVKYQVQKKWHPSKFRIGINTTKSFKDISEPSIFLNESDIFFIDIGPVLDNHEGDFGETFVLGENEIYKKLKEASHDVFRQTKKAWKELGLNGIELYDFAKQAALNLGYELNERMSGHRVGDFPHHVFFRGGLNSVEEIPIENIWVLEIHLIDIKNNIGAFFEDILMKN